MSNGGVAMKLVERVPEPVTMTVAVPAVGPA